jgi:hypothetical protein
MDINDENIIIKSRTSKKSAEDIDCNPLNVENIGEIEGCCLLDFGDVCLGENIAYLFTYDPNV